MGNLGRDKAAAVLQNFTTAPGKLALSFTHSEHSPFVGSVSIHVFEQVLCAVHTYFSIYSNTLARMQEVFCPRFTLTQMWGFSLTISLLSSVSSFVG